MIFFKIHKKVFIAVFSVVFAMYAAFLFILPNVINLNNYKKDIQKIVFDNTELNYDFKDLKIITTYDLKAGVKIEGSELSYPDKQKIASISNIELKISLLPLLFKTLQVSDITVENPELFLLYTKDSQIDLIDYITKKMEKQQETPDTAATELPLKISEKLPYVGVKNYKLSLKDEKTSDEIELKGDSFVLDKTVLNKHFRVASNGKIFLNGNENVVFDVCISSFFPVLSQTDVNTEISLLPQIDFIKELVTYSPKAEIIADLKFKEHAGHVDITGKVYADKISIVLNNKRLPDSYFHLKSSDHKTQIDSNLYVNENEKAVFQADITQGRKTKIDLNVKTDKISFSSIQEFICALLNSMNIENDISLFSTKGFINSDFTLKTDLKKFESSGFFKVINGSVAHKTIPVSIKGIAADIDLSDNNVNIKKASAVVNDTSITAKGTIDAKANADISAESGKIDIAPLFNAFAPIDLKKAYNLKKGNLCINIIVKGRLAEIEPDINVSLKNLLLTDKVNTFAVSNSSALLNIKPKGSSFYGDVELNGSNVKINNYGNPNLNFNAPSLKVKITPDTITIVPFDVTLNSSKIGVSGSIKNYMKKMKIDIFAKGSISANDLKNLLPKDAKSLVDAKGIIPLYASITGNDKKIELNAQAYSNSSNYFSPVTIKKMAAKPGLLNLSLVYSGDTLSVTDASLYQSGKTAFSEDFTYNKKGAQRIAGLSGLVSDVLSSRPSLKLNFSVPQAILVSNSSLTPISLQTKGDVNIYGGLNAPVFKGFFSIKDVNLTDFLTKVQDADLELNGEIISLKVQNLDINGTSMNIDADASTKFGNLFLVKTMKVSSSNFDADKLFEAMDKMAKLMPQQTGTGSGASQAGLVFPVKISNGYIDIQKFKMKQVGGDFIATNISSDFNLANDNFKMNNLKANVYGGTIAGSVIYNLATTAVSAKINGKGINANNVVTVFAALKDQVIGNVDFDANVNLKGATYEQQMKTLNGAVNFGLKDGQMGSLGRFETFLKADNLLSQGFIVTKIGSLVNTIGPYNTGKFEDLSGDLKIVNGTAHLNPVKMSGPHMSLLITGQVNILSMMSSMEILGSLSPEVEAALGPVADLSVEKFAAYIPKFGAAIAAAMNNYNEAVNKSVLAKIPPLTPAKDGTKSFKVILNGNLNNPPSAIKRFYWLNTPEKIQEQQQSLLDAVKPVIPASKEELKQQVKEGIQNQLEKNEKIQELKQNKAVQTFGSIYKFYKDNTKSNSSVNTESIQNVPEGSN